MLSLIYAILITVLLTYTLLWFCTFHTLKSKYRFYKVTYLALKNNDYELSRNDHDFITFTCKNFDGEYNRYYTVCPITGVINFNEITFFKDGGSIKLVSSYLHRSFMLAFDPWSLYWYRKIKKEIMWNSRTLAEIREAKLKRLLK
jgi:hypothetical protein